MLHKILCSEKFIVDQNVAGLGDVRNARVFWLGSLSEFFFLKTENKVEILLCALALGPGVWRYFVLSVPSFRVRLPVSVISVCRGQLKCDGTRAETRFRLSAKRTSPFKSAGASVQSTTGSRGVRISDSNAGYTMFRGSVRVLATPSICQFPQHFPSRASPCAITFQLESTTGIRRITTFRSTTDRIYDGGPIRM